MTAPNRLDFTPEQTEALIDRLEREALTKEDYPLLMNLLKAMVWMNFSLQEKQLSIQRLRSIFGIKTESAKSLAKFIGQQTAGVDGADAPAEENNDQKATAPDTNSDSKTAEKKKGKHGHRPASGYTQAKTIGVGHQTLQKGSVCPSCQMGRLFNLSPGTVIHIVGQRKREKNPSIFMS